MATADSLYTTAVQHGVQVLGVNTDLVGGRHYNRPLASAMMPAGINGAEGKYETGSIVPISTTTAGVNMGSNALDPTDALRQKYGFRFLYNPASVAISTALNNSVANTGDTGFAYMANMQTLGFQLFLNRVSVDTITDMNSGTLDDLEYLYTVINGPAAAISGMGTTADIGMILPNPIKVIFGPRFAFTGYVNALSVTHQMFQRGMIPVLTTVDINMTRAFGDVQSLWSDTYNSGAGPSDTPAKYYDQQKIPASVPTQSHGYGGGNY